MEHLKQTKERIYGNMLLAIIPYGLSKLRMPEIKCIKCVFVVLMAMAIGTHGQGQHLANLGGENADASDNPNQAKYSLEEVLTEIESKYQLHFNYANEIVRDKAVQVDLSKINEENVEKSLGKILEPFGMTYEKVHENIYGIYLEKKKKKGNEVKKIQRQAPEKLKERTNESKRNRVNLSAISSSGLGDFESWFNRQELTVSGQVSSEEEEPLPGVNVVVQGTSEGTVTDVNGEYSLQAPEDGTLVFSFVGYLTKEIPINGRSSIDVSMSQDVAQLDEVVVVGYGTERKENLTGSVSTIDAEEISDRSFSTLSQTLQGASPNLNLTQNTYSTEPGGELSINIRGVGSLTGDYSPYILVDGVPVDNLSGINQNDIESITVLKDAAASAIYGARAPYGVVKITTKSGKEGEDIEFGYSNNISLSSPLGRPHNVNSIKYATAHNQALINAGQAPNFTDKDFTRMQQYQDGEIDEETYLKPDGSDWMGNGIWSQHANGNNDWMYIYYKDRVMRQRHNMSVSGGGENTSFYLSGGYLDQPGELRYGDERYNRYNLTANLNAQATDWLSVNLKTKYIQENKQTFMTRDGWDRQTMYHNFFRNSPYRPLKLPNGEYSNISYIKWLTDGGRRQINNEDLILTLGTEIEPVENWVTRINYNYKENDARETAPGKTVYGHYPDGSEYAMTFPISQYTNNVAADNYRMYNIVSSYNHNINEHNFNILGGYENEVSRFRSLWGRKTNMVTGEVPSISTSVGEKYVDDELSHWATQGIFGRFQYNYQEKYLFEFNGRYDGSSRFEKGNRWGFFPSLSVGYNISKEAFWNSIEPFISRLKIRGSWGSLGNQNVPNYLYLSNIGIGSELGWIMGDERPTYTTTPGLVSENLTWETSTTTNVGLDMGFIENRLSVTFDVFERMTRNMFGPAEAVPAILGTSPPQKNNATLRTRGFELSVGWKDDIGEVSYNINADLSDNVSTVVEYNNPSKTLSTWYEGQRLGEIWGLTTEGIYQTDAAAAENGPDQSIFWSDWGAGDIHYKDVNGDGKITRGDWTAVNSGDFHVIGNNRPRYNVGLNTSLKWKGIDFNMFWQGVLKRDQAFPGGSGMTFFGFEGHHWWDMNMWKKGDNTTLNYWRPEDETNRLGPNTDAYYPKPYLSPEDFKNKQIQTRYTQSSAYMRLKNISLGYTLPDALTEGISLSKTRIYVSGSNLLTFTPLVEFFDPETVGSGSFWGAGKKHFMRKMYAIGVDVTF